MSPEFIGVQQAAVKLLSVGTALDSSSGRKCCWKQLLQKGTDVLRPLLLISLSGLSRISVEAVQAHVGLQALAVHGIDIYPKLRFSTRISAGTRIVLS